MNAQTAERAPEPPFPGNVIVMIRLSCLCANGQPTANRARDKEERPCARHIAHADCPPVPAQVRKPRTHAEILGKAWGWWKGPFQPPGVVQSRTRSLQFANLATGVEGARARRSATVHLRIENRPRPKYRISNFSAVVDQWGR